MKIEIKAKIVVQVLMGLLLLFLMIAAAYYRTEGMNLIDVHNEIVANLTATQERIAINNYNVGFLIGVCTGTEAEKNGIEITDELISLCDKSVAEYISGLEE